MQTGPLWDSSLGFLLVDSRVTIVLQQLSLSRSGERCQITPDGHAGEAPFLRNFPAHASMCCSQGERDEADQDPRAVLH